MKTILITGGRRGIGRATALLAGARGWSVGINYVGDVAAAEATAQDVRAAGGRAVTVKGDVSVEGDVIAMFEIVAAAFGPLAGLVVNAGVVAQPSRLAEVAEAIVWLLSDAASYVTGALLDVAGGR